MTRTVGEVCKKVGRSAILWKEVFQEGENDQLWSAAQRLSDMKTELMFLHTLKGIW